MTVNVQYESHTRFLLVGGHAGHQCRRKGWVEADIAELEYLGQTVWTSRNGPFTALLLLLCATVVLDPVYRFILRDIRAAVIHKSLVLFAALAFLVPVFTGAHTLEALALAGAFAGGISTTASRLTKPAR